jgi:hypothetical protein
VHNRKLSVDVKNDLQTVVENKPFEFQFRNHHPAGPTPDISLMLTRHRNSISLSQGRKKKG